MNAGPDCKSRFGFIALDKQCWVIGRIMNNFFQQWKKKEEAKTESSEVPEIAAVWEWGREGEVAGMFVGFSEAVSENSLLPERILTFCWIHSVQLPPVVKQCFALINCLLCNVYCECFAWEFCMSLFTLAIVATWPFFVFGSYRFFSPTLVLWCNNSLTLARVTSETSESIQHEHKSSSIFSPKHMNNLKRNTTMHLLLICTTQLYTDSFAWFPWLDCGRFPECPFSFFFWTRGSWESCFETLSCQKQRQQFVHRCSVHRKDLKQPYFTPLIIV